MRNTIVAVALLASAMPLAAQVRPQGDNDPTNRVAGTGLPAGWHLRVDDKDARRNMTANDVRFSAAGAGYRITSGPAALYYSARDMMRGAYTVRATLTQARAPRHAEAFGLFAGGSALEGEQQQYMYFLVRGDGKFLINHRAGAEVHKIVDWTAHEAVRAQDASGRMTNELEIRVTADSISFVANGAVVRAFAKSQLHGFNTDGQAGLRVNHNLDIEVARFEARATR